MNVFLEYLTDKKLDLEIWFAIGLSQFLCRFKHSWKEAMWTIDAEPHFVRFCQRCLKLQECTLFDDWFVYEDVMDAR